MKEIEIPEGYEARIDGNKVIIELKENEDERIRKELIDHCIQGSKQRTIVSHKEDYKRWLAWLEKQKEQKPIKKEKVWTIYDAKEGDVLNSTRVQATIIFKGFADDGKHILAYCALQKGFFLVQELPWDRDFEPASEYWKNALYDAMTEKGYSWDADNLELKKIEQKPAEWSEEDKKNLQGVIDEIEANKNTAPSYDIPVYDRFLSWLKSLRPHSCCELDTETRDALNEVINFLASHKSSHYNDYLFSIMNRLRQQLKSCKPHWKPSEEQIHAIVEALKYIPNNKEEWIILENLMNDLQKLL